MVCYKVLFKRGIGMGLSEQEINELLTNHPILEKVKSAEPVVWFNAHQQPMDSLITDITEQDVSDAEDLMYRFRPFLKRAFPELEETNGVLESPLQKITHFRRSREKASKMNISGAFYLKCDNDLPVAGSIKARGGFYEVLHYAESLALK